MPVSRFTYKYPVPLTHVKRASNQSNSSVSALDTESDMMTAEFGASWRLKAVVSSAAEQLLGAHNPEEKPNTAPFMEGYYKYELKYLRAYDIFFYPYSRSSSLSRRR